MAAQVLGWLGRGDPHGRERVDGTPRSRGFLALSPIVPGVHDVEGLRGKHVVFLSWRDTGTPRAAAPRSTSR